MKSEATLVRFLVPCRTRQGKIEYRVETRHIRLPLRRDERAQLSQRLAR